MGLRIEGSGKTKNNNDAKALVSKSEKEIASEALAKNISGDKTNLSSVDDVSIASLKKQVTIKNLDTSVMYPIHEEIDGLYESLLKEKGTVSELDFVTTYLEKYDTNNMAQALNSFNRTKSIKEGTWTPQKEAQYIGTMVTKMVISATDSSTYASEKLELSDKIMSDLGIEIGEFNPDLPPKLLDKVIAQYQKQWNCQNTKYRQLVQNQTQT